MITADDMIESGACAEGVVQWIYKNWPVPAALSLNSIREKHSLISEEEDFIEAFLEFLNEKSLVIGQTFYEDLDNDYGITTGVGNGESCSYAWPNWFMCDNEPDVYSMCDNEPNVYGVRACAGGCDRYGYSTWDMPYHYNRGDGFAYYPLGDIADPADCG